MVILFVLKKLAGVVVGVAVLVLLPDAAGATGTEAVTRPGVVRAAARDVIICKPQANNPHYSHHAAAVDKDRVNATGSVTCTKNVAKLRIKVILYKQGHRYKESAWKTVTGKRYASQNASRRCVKKQTYQSKVLVEVVFPVNYLPATGSNYKWSKKVSIKACKKKN